MPEFCRKYQTGLNIQPGAFKHMVVPIHSIDTQYEIARTILKIAEMEGRIEHTIENAKGVKQNMLHNMFV